MVRPELPPPKWGDLPLPPDLQRHWLEDVACPMEKLNKLGGDESTDPLQEADVLPEVCHLLPAAMSKKAEAALEEDLCACESSCWSPWAMQASLAVLAAL